MNAIGRGKSMVVWSESVEIRIWFEGMYERRAGGRHG